MSPQKLRGRIAVAGIGSSRYFRHGQSPDAEFKLALQAILEACADAGIAPTDIDGFSSFAEERSEPTRLSAALGLPRLRTSILQWGGGGGGCCAAVANAAAAIFSGQANCVVVYRSLAQGQSGRFGQAGLTSTAQGERAYLAPYGVLAPPQRFAMRVQRFIHKYGVQRSATRAIAMAASYHAQQNPAAVMYGKPLDAKRYDEARWITEPFSLFDCCMENDGAAAIILMDASNLPEKALAHAGGPAYLLGAATGSGFRAGADPHNAPDYAAANYAPLAEELFRSANIAPQDVDSVQCYENFTGGVVMALAEHQLFSLADINAFLQLENLIAPHGQLPLNTSGGNLACCYLQGFELVLEGVRQIRGESSNPVPNHDVALVIGGPMVSPASNLLFGSAATL